MSFFISDAMAEAGDAAAQQPGMLEALLPFIILFVVFWFLLIRPQQKRVKEHKALVEGLGKGDEVVLQGGILGRITDVGEAFLTVKVADNVELKVQRDAVSNIMPKGTYKEA